MLRVGADERDEIVGPELVLHLAWHP
jgi:hypothetical protein